MARIPLLGGAYKQASAIAGAQRCINLYPEFNTERMQAPVPVTHYGRPGLTLLGKPPIPGPGRALYALNNPGGAFNFTNTQIITVVGQQVYGVSPDFGYLLLGSMTSNLTTPVSITDNGITLFLVDGSRFGSQVDIGTGTFSNISDPSFMGSTRADFLDGFVIFNKPNSPTWYSTTSYSNTFNPLFFGTKTAWPDNIKTIIVNERQAWIFGQYKGEIWQNAALVPFPFQLLSGNIVEYGVAAPYAVVKTDVDIYWLSQSPEGARMVMKGVYNVAERVSTHAIEEEWLSYSTVSDCVATAYQIRGHFFVEFHFPTADRTWVYDKTTGEWHEKAFFDSNGVQHRSNDTFKAYAYGKNLALDWSSGALYQVDETNFTDNGIPLQYRRGFPHLLDNNSLARITLWRVTADMECGFGGSGSGGDPFSSGFSSGFGPLGTQAPPAQVTLKVSRDRGNTFFVHSTQPLGVTLPPGYSQKPTFYRCGYGYDMVIQLEWAGPVRSALNGAFAEIEMHDADT